MNQEQGVDAVIKRARAIVDVAVYSGYLTKEEGERVYQEVSAKALLEEAAKQKKEMEQDLPLDAKYRAKVAFAAIIGLLAGAGSLLGMLALTGCRRGGPTDEQKHDIEQYKKFKENQKPGPRNLHH
jgi:hypothetical protein